MTYPLIRSQKQICEVGWFDDLCGGDTEFLGVPDPARGSSFEHCSEIIQLADELGYDNILLPTSYMLGQETIPFAAAAALQTKQINLLTAVRTGEIHPPMLARHLATLDHMLKGRLTVNIINSDLPGLKEDHNLRYKRCEEVIEILKMAWTTNRIEHNGEIYPSLNMDAAPVKPFQQHGGPLLYFGGISPGSKDVAAKHCDVFLMWPEPMSSIKATIEEMSKRAQDHHRTIDFGLRIHVIVRETEEEARAYAKHIMSKFDPEGYNLKHLTQDSKSAGVLRQDEARKQLADQDDFIEPHLWMGIGKARSGCGGAIVGNPQQVLDKIDQYMQLGIRAFIFSGYPLMDEAKHVAKWVLPHLPQAKLNMLQGRNS
jgi:alkanesulfonate monooxygenase